MNAQRLHQIEALLHGWKCPGCGGSGNYHQNRVQTERKLRAGEPVNAQYNPGPKLCRVCGGRGLAPAATEALALLREG